MKYFVLMCALFMASFEDSVSEECPTVDVVQNFTLDNYLGVWYEIQRYKNSFQREGDCGYAVYSYSSANKNVTVVNSAVNLAPNPPEPSPKRYKVQGKAYLANPDAVPPEGRLKVEFIVRGVPNVGDYNILHTDYNGYSIVWSCRKWPSVGIKKFAWVLSRTRALRPDQREEIDALINAPSNPIDSSNFRTTIQEDSRCFVL